MQNHDKQDHSELTQVPGLSCLVAQITPENRYDEVGTSFEVGKESVEW